MILDIPAELFSDLHTHLFQNDLEQGAFLFGQSVAGIFAVRDMYLIPPEGWAVQMDIYLEMNDTQRAHAMGLAMQGDWSIVDCHSHPGAIDDVWFSPSDIAGITAFAQYAKWKLQRRPYIAAVMGEESIDAVYWADDFKHARPLTELRIVGLTQSRSLLPRNSWFKEPRAYRRKATNKDERR